jgi:hypothetical protein
MWKEHFWNLLHRAQGSTLVLGGSTVAGIVVVGIIGCIFGYVSMSFIEWGRGGWNMTSFKSALRSWPPYVAGVVGFLLSWCLLFSWSVCVTIYKDHQDLVAANHRLKEENRILNPSSSGLPAPNASRGAPIAPQNHPKPISVPSKPAESHQSATGQNGAAVGSITLGSGSIAQVGGTGNTAVIQGTKDWSLTRAQQVNLQNALAAAPGRIRMGWPTGDPSCIRYAGQLAYAFHEAGWKIENQVPGYAGSICWPSADWDCFGLGVTVRNRSGDSAWTAITALSVLVPTLHVDVSEKYDEDLVDVLVSKAPQ